MEGGQDRIDRNKTCTSELFPEGGTHHDRSSKRRSGCAACAAVSLVAFHVYMSSKAEAIPHAVTASKADATASKRIKDNDFKASRPMGPIYPTIGTDGDRRISALPLR